MIAVDFTGSNSRHNLHSPDNNNPTKPGSTPYERAMYILFFIKYRSSVGSILLDYDTDKLIPFYGFGAVSNYPLPAIKRECFPCNFNEDDPNVLDLEGLHEAYLNALDKISFSGPTHFAPIIRQAIRLAKEDPQVYTVLLLLTDGQNDDMDETIDAIFEANDAPLSIVIVGIGPEDFTRMHILDGDEDGEYGSLTNNAGEVLKRDLVQFVSFSDFDGPGSSLEDLAKEVLEEVPEQLSQYYADQGIKPEDLAGGVSKTAIQHQDLPVAVEAGDELVEDMTKAAHKDNSQKIKKDKEMVKFSVDQIPALAGKNFVVTGANVGLGYETCYQIAKKGGNIFMCFRNKEKSQKAADTISQLVKENGGTFYEVILDLASLKSVKEAAEDILSKNVEIDCLINNAGVMMCPKGETEDGFETQFGTNHLGHFAFTSYLYQNIAEAAKKNPEKDYRIVNLTSSLHKGGPKEGILFDDLKWEKNKYTPTLAYGHSKFANVVFTQELCDRVGENEALKNLYVNCVHPGFVDTDLTRHVRKQYIMGGVILFIFKKLKGAINVHDGALTQLVCFLVCSYF
eukprot:maker-scaffold_25-augustus-gene-4.52-mRNA-1 protein AED:0.22 eAED:0.24 QI:1536/0/0.25/1/0.33/0.5/4/0/567